MSINDFTFEIVDKYDSFLSKENKESFIVKSSSNKSKVLLSCPHAVSQLRQGRIKSAEKETGIIGLLLNELYGYPLICKTSNKGDDANYDPSSGYKDEIIRLIKENGYRCVIDLHQLSYVRSENINPGVAGYKNFPHKELLNDIVSIFNRYGIDKVSIDHPFGSYSDNTVSSYVHSHMGIDTIQLEINSRLVSKYCNKEYIKSHIKEVTEALHEIIIMLDKFYEEN